MTKFINTELRNFSQLVISPHCLHIAWVSLWVAENIAILANFGLHFQGSNPIGLAAPCTPDDSDRFSMDMSTTCAGAGKVFQHLRRGQQMPQGWAMDPSVNRFKFNFKIKK